MTSEHVHEAWGAVAEWDAVRNGARDALQEAAIQWLRDGNYPLDQWDPAEAAFVAGGEWMIDTFALAMRLRGGGVVES